MFCRSAVFSVSSLSHWCLPSVPLAPTLLVVCNATMQCDILPITTVYVSWNYTRCLFKILWEDGGASVISYHSGLATRSEGYDPFTDPYQNFLKVDNHGGQSMTSVTWRWIPGSGDTWCQCQRIILTLWPWHLWNMDKHNDNDGIKIKTKINAQIHQNILFLPPDSHHITSYASISNNHHY